MDSGLIIGLSFLFLVVSLIEWKFHTFSSCFKVASAIIWGGIVVLLVVFIVVVATMSDDLKTTVASQLPKNIRSHIPHIPLPHIPI